MAWTHGYSQSDLREAAISAPRGDIPVHQGDLEDISGDDSIFDLIAERDVVNSEEFYDRVDAFASGIFEQGNTMKTATDTDMEYPLAGDIDIEIYEGVPTDNVSATDAGVPGVNVGDDDPESAEHDNVTNTMDEHLVNHYPDVSVNGDIDVVGNDSIIVVSSDEDDFDDGTVA